MNCRKAQNLISEHLDNMLSPDTAKQLEEHLQICPHCSSELQAMKENIQNLKDLPKIEADENFLKEVRAKIETRKKNILPFLNLKRTDLIRVAALLCICFFILKMTDFIDRSHHPFSEDKKSSRVMKLAKKAPLPKKSEEIVVAQASKELGTISEEPSQKSYLYQTQTSPRDNSE